MFRLLARSTSRERPVRMQGQTDTAILGRDGAPGSASSEPRRTTLSHVAEYESQGTSPPKGSVCCARCRQERWPGAVTGPYTCQRCREVMAGGNAVDPCPSAAQRAARTVAGERLRAFRAVPVSRGSRVTEAPRDARSEEPSHSV